MRMLTAIMILALVLATSPIVAKPRTPHVFIRITNNARVYIGFIHQMATDFLKSRNYRRTTDRRTAGFIFDIDVSLIRNEQYNAWDAKGRTRRSSGSVDVNSRESGVGVFADLHLAPEGESLFSAMASQEHKVSGADVRINVENYFRIHFNGRTPERVDFLFFDAWADIEAQKHQLNILIIPTSTHKTY